MIDEPQIIVIRDNPLTEELESEAILLINKLKSVDFPERYSFYNEALCLISRLIQNKNQNYQKCLQKIKLENIFENIEIATIYDKKTEEFIKDIQNLLVSKNINSSEVMRIKRK